MIIMIKRPFNFLDHFDAYDEDQDRDHNIEAACEDHDPRTI